MPYPRLFSAIVKQIGHCNALKHLKSSGTKVCMDILYASYVLHMLGEEGEVGGGGGVTSFIIIFLFFFFKYLGLTC